MVCAECKHLMKFGNSDECGQGVCSRGSDWQPVGLQDICHYEPRPYKCKDCHHFVIHDTACFTARAEDEICCGFEDEQYYNLCNVLFDWICRGKSDKDCTNLFTQALNEMRKA